MLDLREVSRWEGDRLAFDESAVAKLSRSALSPSTANAMGGCVVRWAAERLLPRPSDPFGAAEIGTSAHAVMEDLMNRPAYMRTRHEALRILEQHKLQFWRGTDARTVARRADWHTQVHNAFDGLFAIEDPKRVNVVGSEIAVSGILIDDVPFNGFIDRVDEVLFEGSAAEKVVDYKGLAVNTPIPTPTGWTTMGDLRVGDRVLATNGAPCSVVGKSQVKNLDCYRLTFNDGTSIVCDEEHLWQVDELCGSEPKSRLLDAPSVYALFKSLQAKGRTRSLVINNAKSLDLPVADLPIDPWILGAWLGDGSSKTGEITLGAHDEAAMLALVDGRWGRATLRKSADRAKTVTLGTNDPYGRETLLVRPAAECMAGHKVEGGVFPCPRCTEAKAEIRSAWRKGRTRSNDDSAQTCAYGHARRGATRKAGARCNDCTNELNAAYAESLGRDVFFALPGPTVTTHLTLRGLLREADLLKNKHIPVKYLRASYEQRLALLAGLCDTDGHWHAGRKRVVFVTSSDSLAAGFVELVSTFGVSVQVFKRWQENETRPSTWVHMIEFKPVGFNPFMLPRKAEQVDAWAATVEPRATMRATRRVITNIERVESVASQCISVDSEDRMYLAGESMVPTHNTGKVKKPGFFGDAYGDQLRMYRLARHAQTGTMPVAGQLYFTKFGKLVDVDYSRPAMEKTRFAFRKAWKDLKTYEERGTFPTKEGPLCGWCPLVNTCPVAKAAGRVDKTGGAMPPEFQIPVARSLSVQIPVHSDVDFGSASIDGSFYDDFGSAAVEDAEMRESIRKVVEESRDLSREVDGSAPHTDEATLNETGEPLMSDIQLSEDKPWMVESAGVLNANSYAAIGLFGTASWAYEEVHKAGVKPSKDLIVALARVLSYVTTTVQKKYTGRAFPDDGMNTRMRGVLHTVIDQYKLPFGQDEAAWTDWVSTAIRHASLLTDIALGLYNDDDVDIASPLGVLGIIPQASIAPSNAA